MPTPQKANTRLRARFSNSAILPAVVMVMAIFPPHSAPQFDGVDLPHDLLVFVARCLDGAMSLEQGIFQSALGTERFFGRGLGFADLRLDFRHVPLPRL